jgi:hypothetical protein
MPERERGARDRGQRRHPGHQLLANLTLAAVSLVVGVSPVHPHHPFPMGEGLLPDAAPRDGLQ